MAALVGSARSAASARGARRSLSLMRNRQWRRLGGGASWLIGVIIMSASRHGARPRSALARACISAHRRLGGAAGRRRLGGGGGIAAHRRVMSRKRHHRGGVSSASRQLGVGIVMQRSHQMAARHRRSNRRRSA